MAVKQTKALILGVEASRRAIVARLRKFGVMQRDRGRIFVHPKTLKASPGAYRDVVAFMKAQDIGMLVIDTISQFWTIENENDNAEVAPEDRFGVAPRIWFAPERTRNSGVDRSGGAKEPRATQT